MILLDIKVQYNLLRNFFFLVDEPHMNRDVNAYLILLLHKFYALDE